MIRTDQDSIGSPLVIEEIQARWRVAGAAKGTSTEAVSAASHRADTRTLFDSLTTKFVDGPFAKPNIPVAHVGQRLGGSWLAVHEHAPSAIDITSRATPLVPVPVIEGAS